MPTGRAHRRQSRVPKERAPHQSDDRSVGGSACSTSDGDVHGPQRCDDRSGAAHIEGGAGDVADDDGISPLVRNDPRPDTGMTGVLRWGVLECGQCSRSEDSRRGGPSAHDLKFVSGYWDATSCGSFRLLVLRRCFSGCATPPYAYW
jgi:hypothetical protein